MDYTESHWRLLPFKSNVIASQTRPHITKIICRVSGVGPESIGNTSIIANAKEMYELLVDIQSGEMGHNTAVVRAHLIVSKIQNQSKIKQQ